MPYLDTGPGFQRTDTSYDAAIAVSSKAATLQAAVLALLEQNPRGMDSEQIAEVLGCDYVSIQPRTSELRNQGLIYDSGERRLSRYNRQIIVWRHRDHKPAQQGELAL